MRRAGFRCAPIHLDRRTFKINLMCFYQPGYTSTIGDVKAGFSNYGTPFVNVFAPGTQIFSTWPNSRYRWLQGTSMACPHVTGLAALLMSLRNTVSPAQIKELIEQNVQKKSQYKNVVTSGGLINVESAISALIGSGSSDPRTGK